ncbi:hypothetical protein POM88_024499 [Heracleum sosnowskyi]|uniref:Uncharacterized protein n=1 Tax=Heracleum sosnowskyi TaxID=360622 RepID=A0AAD8I581_9APIA|nr:hypothetical protein POM88_024499 [Heracleum sosnowskyi]
MWKESFEIVINNEGDVKKGATDLESIVTNLNLDTGLGVIDAFFASLSMILVSERPYNLPVEARYSFENGVRRMWVYANDKSHGPNSQTQPRTEVRIMVLMKCSTCCRILRYDTPCSNQYDKRVNVVRGLKLYDEIFTDTELSKLTDYVNELRVAGQNGELSGLLEKVLRDEKCKDEDATLLVLGDIVSIKLGGIVPSDVHLLEGGA